VRSFEKKKAAKQGVGHWLPKVSLAGDLEDLRRIDENVFLVAPDVRCDLGQAFTVRTG
jgi:hypothetical protein